MTDPLDELAEALAAATPGPWIVDDDDEDDVRVIVDEGIHAPTGVIVVATVGQGEPDAHFIALCGTRVPTLIERLRAADADNARLREALAELEHRVVVDDQHGDAVAWLFSAALHPEEPS